MNVEVCTTVKSVKYIFKYIHTGNNMAHVEIREGYKEANAGHDIVHDEIHQYPKSRYVGPHQAVYKLMQYEMHDKSHTIIQLAIHLPHQQPLCFTDPEQAAQRNNDSMLIAYFSLNQREDHAHQYLYQDIPEHYTYNKSAKQWQQRKRRSAKGVIGRIYNVLPSDPERFALRLLLLHRKGATSFKDIKTVDGITDDTLKNAARAMSLLEDDAEHRQCLRDAVVQHSSSFKLRATLMLSSQDSKKTCQKINVRRNGIEPYDDQDQINLPQQICIKSLEDLMNSIYPQAESADAHLLLDPNTMSERCCLTPKNKFSHHINELILQRLPTPGNSTSALTESKQMIQKRLQHIPWSFSMRKPQGNASTFTTIKGELKPFLSFS
eukprot:gene21048-biopygen14617